MRATRRMLPVLLAASTVLAACGGGGGSTSVSQPPTADGLRSAARTAAAAILHNDAKTSYAYLSSACQRQVSLTKFAGQVLVGMAVLEGFTKTKLSDLHIDKVATRNVTDKSGEVQLTVKASGTTNFDNNPGWEHWVYESGSWHTTKCEVTSSGSSSSDTTTTTNSATFLSSTDFAGAPTNITIDGARYHDLTYHAAFTGSYTVTLETTHDFGTSIPAEFGSPTQAQGRFIGVRYKLGNRTSGDLQADSAFGEQVRITDGQASWKQAPFSAITGAAHQTSAADPAQTTGAGFTTDTWVVFDVPTSVTPKGLVIGLDSPNPTALGLPAAS